MRTNSPHTSTLALCVLGAISGGMADHASAFQLGQLQENSRLGAPLDAYINVLMNPREARLATELSLIPDFEYRNDAAMNAALANIRAELVKSDYGQHYVRLTSDTNLDVPLIAFRIKASNGDSILIRRYAIAPKPAVPAVVRPPRTRGQDQVATNRQQRVTPAAVTTATSIQTAEPFSASEYGPVKAGDTLWKIATRVAGNKAGTILNELFVLNPHAFIDGDINKLRQGVTLKIPASVAAPSETMADSNATVEAVPAPLDLAPSAEEFVGSEEPSMTSSSAANTRSESASPAVAIDEPVNDDVSANVAIATPANVSVSTSKLAPDWQSENPELAERLQSLGEKYAALRARYETQQAKQSATEIQTAYDSTGLAVVDVAPITDISNEPTVAPALSEPDVAVSVVEDPVDLAEEEPVELSVSSRSQAAVANSTLPSADKSRFPLPFWLIGLIGLGVIAGGASFYLYRLRKVAETRLQEQQARKEKDNSLKEELAKKAQHRIKMEDEVERMLHERTGEEPVDEVEQTLQLSVDEVLPAQVDELELDVEQDDSPEHQINDSIAHGRYGEAEDLLREVIKDSPRNYSAKLRLAEVYYITERIEEFVEISQDIHAHHRAEISDEDWRRVMRMGKMIAPDQPPFSGPQSIVDQASAG